MKRQMPMISVLSFCGLAGAMPWLQLSYETGFRSAFKPRRTNSHFVVNGFPYARAVIASRTRNLDDSCAEIVVIFPVTLIWQLRGRIGPQASKGLSNPSNVPTIKRGGSRGPGRKIRSHDRSVAALSQGLQPVTSSFVSRIDFKHLLIICHRALDILLGHIGFRAVN